MSQTIYVSSLLKDKYKDFSPEFFDEINRLKQAGNTVIWDAESILDRAPNINEAVDVIQDYAKKGYKFQINYETLQNRFKNQAKDIADSMKSDGFKVYNEPTEPAKPVVPQVPPSEGGIWDALMAQPRLQAAAGIQALEKAKQLATNPTVAQIAAGAAAPFIGHKPTPETVQHTVSQGIEGLQGIGQAQLALSDKNLYQKALEGLTATSQFQTKRREGQTPNREDFVTDLEHLAPAMRIVNLLASQVYAVPQVGLDFADSVMQMALSPASEKFKGKSKESQKWERPLGAGMEMVNQVVSNLAQNAGFSKEFSDELGGIGGFAFLHYLTKGARELKDMRGRQRAEAFQTRVRELEKQMDESVAQAAATVSKSTEPTEKIPLAPEIQSPEAIASLKQEVPIGQEVQGQEKVIPTELKPIVEGGQNAENVRLNQEVTPQKPPELAAVQGQIGGGGNLREAQAEGGGGYPNLRGAGETPPQEVAPTEVPAPTYVGAGKPKTYTNIVDPMHPDVGFRLKLERALFGEGNLFPGESRLHRLWQKAGADFSNRVNRFMYSVEKLQKIAGEKLPDAKNPWTRYVNFLGLNNKFFDTMENGPIDPANPFRRMSEGPMHIIDRLPEIQGQPVIDSYKEAMQYGVAKRTLAEKQRAIDAANQEPDLQTRDRALKEVEAKDAANRFSGIGEGKMPDTAKAQEIIAAVDANPLKADVYSDFANRYKQIGDSLIDYAVKRGRISAEQGTAIKDSRDDYVSFKRVYDQIFQRQAFGSASNAPGQDHAIMHRYEGSDRIIEDPMVNLMQMTYDIMKESDLNRVRQDYVDLVDTANQVDPRVGNSILWEVPNKSEGTMTVYKNGQPHYYAGETMLMKQFKGLEGSTPSDNIALNAMRTAAQIFKGSVTHSPPFAFMNWMRAAVEYPLLSTAVTNPLQSVASTLDLFTKAGEKKASEAAQYGLGAQWYMKSRENFYKRQQTAIRELSRAPGSIVATDAKKLLEAYNKITDVSELGPRMAEFNKVLENEILRGADYESSMMKASAKAADLPNFALAGNLMQSLNRYVPFTNPTNEDMNISGSTGTNAFFKD